MITRKQLINKYIKFFKSKNHKLIPNSSLVPANDPTVLFTTAGMHPLVPYLLGQKHPLGNRLVNVQRCIRTTDIEEVGDATHHTFFEMLGNWSLGDYWKKEAIEWSYEFLTSKKWLGIDKSRIAISVFSGDKDARRDNESANVWKSLGVNKVKFLGKKENWWGPAGTTGPSGPDTEMFVRGIEIWNDVFMEYNKTASGKFEPLKQKNVDTGMGVERTLAVLNGFDDSYMTEVWKPIIEKIEKLSGKSYKGNEKAMRIIADHIKASVFIIADGVLPSNTGQGYVLRRLIRRAVRWEMRLNLKNMVDKIAEPVFDIYEDNYKELKQNKKKIIDELIKEEQKFNLTIKEAVQKLKEYTTNKPKQVSAKDMFLLFQSFGMPKELIKEELEILKLPFPEKAFERELKKHQQLSRTASAGVFKSGLADHSKATTRLHTATHLLNESLRQVLGPEVKQRGSNITPGRLRFDFNFPRKLTNEEIKKVENLVNEKIKQGLEVKRSEMKLSDALKSGAQSEFGARYPEVVSVYTIGLDKKPFSREICTGPHVKNTREIGKFNIIKEESSAGGIRRIKAVVG